jgi:hypothetical protein
MTVNPLNVMTDPSGRRLPLATGDSMELQEKRHPQTSREHQSEPGRRLNGTEIQTSVAGCHTVLDSSVPECDSDGTTVDENASGPLTAEHLQVSLNPGPRSLQQFGVLLPTEVDQICAEETQTQYLIEGLLPAKSIAIVGGDSTIGKSSLICQLALCVASGIPFLGMATMKSRVLYYDLENSLQDCKIMRDALVKFLALEKPPENFLLVPEPRDLEQLIVRAKPGLVVIDSLRAFRPEVTEKNSIAGLWLMEIRGLARKYGCAFAFIHHLRKPGEGSPTQNLDEECRVADWLLQMEGPRALVNQTDVRIAVAGADCNPVALKMKWSRRVHGDSPLVLLERIYEDAEPAGYHQLTGFALLSPDRQKALEKLPIEFSFREAKYSLGRTDDPTNKFLAKCRQLGLVEKLERGRYRKSPQHEVKAVAGSDPGGETAEAAPAAGASRASGAPPEGFSSQVDVALPSQ